MSDELTAKIQEHADADHARQPRCNDCGRPGTPYEYKGVRFDGLLSFRGDRVCPVCAQRRESCEGVDILVVDDRPGMEPYVHNTVRDRDKISIVLPPDMRGIDGRDPLPKRRPKRTNFTQDRMAAVHAEAVEEQMLAAELIARSGRDEQA